jgi:hypothetical protein
MNYYKVDGNYIATVGTIEGAETVTKEEYEKHWAEVTETTSHYPDMPTDSEVLNILLGGDTE